MDLSQYGGSTLECKALEKALKRRSKQLKSKERPTLLRANAIIKDEEHNASRTSNTIPLPKSPPAQSHNQQGNENTVEELRLDENGIPMLVQVTPKESDKIDDGKTGVVDVSQSYSFDSFTTSQRSGNTTPFHSEKAFSPRVEPTAQDNYAVEPPLDSVEVRKYFGYTALDGFSQKVSFINKQKCLIDCPPPFTGNRNMHSSSSTERSSMRSSSPQGSLFGTFSSSLPTGRSGIGSSQSRRPTPLSFGSLPSQSGVPKSRSSARRALIARSQSTRSNILNLESFGDMTINDQKFEDENSLVSDLTGILEAYHPCSMDTGRRSSRDMLLSQKMFSDSSSQNIHEHGAVEDVKLEQVQSSPRSAYIMGCLANNLNPRGSHIVRKKISDEVHLEHHGMGDGLIAHLASALQCLPHVRYVNISDNNLTDGGLVNILSKLVDVKSLTTLDMSNNKIGVETANALATYLASNPLLQKLILSNTDIDDFEGEMFVKAIQHSTNLTELNLSRNELGNQEVLNSVRPNTTTAPEELATLLVRDFCPLKHLDVSWNVIRLESAVSLAQSIAVNTSLTFLDLSYNCIGPEGGKVIGESLFDNRSLQTLLLANNNIDSTSSFVIFAAIQQNYALSHLCMDGNPIGVVGAKALMNIPVAAGSRLTLTANKCNVQFRSIENNWFDECDPCGKYCLDLSDSFSRAVAFKLLSIAACHYSYGIKTCTYSEKKDSKGRQIFLEQRLTRDKIDLMTPKEKKILENLCKLEKSSHDIKYLKKLFHEYDFNKSNTLEHFELKVLLKDLGMPVVDSQIENAMAFIDIDKSGSIELPEFVYFMQQFAADVSDRIKDLTEVKVMCERASHDGKCDSDYDSPREDLVQRFIPPKNGFLQIELVDTYCKKASFNIITEADCDNIIDISCKIGQTTEMIGYALSCAKLRFNEALKLFDVMFHDTGNKADVLFIVLPCMIDAMEARVLVSRVTNEDPVEIEFIRKKLGNALRPIYGLPCGYYNMDLSRAKDRICLAKLFEFCITSSLPRKIRSESFGMDSLGDTSQIRNWSSFRNEFFRGELFKILPDSFNPIPREGLLEFDFVSHLQPPIGTHTISDSKIAKILINASLLTLDTEKETRQKMNFDRELLNKCLGANGKTIFSCSTCVAADIGLAQALFYENIPNRNSSLQQSIKREEIKVDYKSKKRSMHLHKKLVSMACMESFMRKGSVVGLPEIRKPTAELPVLKESFEVKFKNFINRPLGENEQKLLESNINSSIDEKISRQPDDISTICSMSITRTEVPVRRHNKSASTPQKSLNDGRSALFPERKSKKKSRKGETVQLPSIVVIKNNERVVLPALSVPKVVDGEEDEGNPIDEFLGKPSQNTNKQNGKYATRAGIMSSCKDLHDKSSLEAEYSEHEKRVEKQTINRRRIRQLIESMGVSKEAKASRLLTMLTDYAGIYWLKCRHVASLVENFTIGTRDKAEYFGTYRVDLVVSLFSKIVDVHNFDVIFRELEPYEQGCLYCRLGWLNLFNPTRPERSYELNMALWEERMVAKALLTLAIIEEGDNITEADFRWSRDMDRMPGWIVTKPWLNESTMQRKGILSMTYASNTSDYERRVIPDIVLRKSLLNMVLSSEGDMLREEQNCDEVLGTQPSKLSKLEGIERMLQDKEQWATYFYGDKNVSSTITSVTKLKK